MKAAEISPFLVTKVGPLACTNVWQKQVFIPFVTLQAEHALLFIHEGLKT